MRGLTHQHAVGTPTTGDEITKAQSDHGAGNAGVEVGASTPAPDIGVEPTPNGAKRREAELLVCLNLLFAVAPWVAVAIQFILTPEQWRALMYGDADAALSDAIAERSKPSLELFGLPVTSNIPDLTQDVLLKLSEGAFFLNYDPARGLPKDFLLGCATNYSLTLARSYARRAMPSAVKRSKRRKRGGRETDGAGPQAGPLA